MPYLHPHSGGIIGIGSVCKGELWKEPTTHLVTLWALGLRRICTAGTKATGEFPSMECILSSAPVSWEGAWRPGRDRLGWRRLGSSLANPRSMKYGQTSSPHPKHGVPWTGMTLPGNLGPARGAGESGQCFRELDPPGIRDLGPESVCLCCGVSVMGNGRAGSKGELS